MTGYKPQKVVDNTRGQRFTVIQGTLGIHQVQTTHIYDGIIVDSWISKTRLM